MDQRVVTHLAGISATLHESCTDKVFANWLEVSLVALSVVPDRQGDLLQHSTALAPVLSGSPSDDL